MELEYTSEKLRKQCSDLKEATKLFGGDKALAISLLARINALGEADSIKDIIVQKPFRFHKLFKQKKRNYEGYFAIDVKARTNQWRIILQPLDNERNPFDPCDIDKIADVVKVVEISEVSKHYE